MGKRIAPRKITSAMGRIAPELVGSFGARQPTGAPLPPDGGSGGGGGGGGRVDPDPDPDPDDYDIHAESFGNHDPESDAGSPAVTEADGTWMHHGIWVGKDKDEAHGDEEQFWDLSVAIGYAGAKTKNGGWLFLAVVFAFVATGAGAAYDDPPQRAYKRPVHIGELDLADIERWRGDDGALGVDWVLIEACAAYRELIRAWVDANERRMGAALASDSVWERHHAIMSLGLRRCLNLQVRRIGVALERLADQIGGTQLDIRLPKALPDDALPSVLSQLARSRGQSIHRRYSVLSRFGDTLSVVVARIGAAMVSDSESRALRY